MEELLARIRAMTQRRAEYVPDTLCYGGVSLDRRRFVPVSYTNLIQQDIFAKEKRKRISRLDFCVLYECYMIFQKYL